MKGKPTNWERRSSLGMVRQKMPTLQQATSRKADFRRSRQQELRKRFDNQWGR